MIFGKPGEDLEGIFEDQLKGYRDAKKKERGVKKELYMKDPSLKKRERVNALEGRDSKGRVQKYFHKWEIERERDTKGGVNKIKKLVKKAAQSAREHEKELIMNGIGSGAEGNSRVREIIVTAATDLTESMGKTTKSGKFTLSALLKVLQGINEGPGGNMGSLKMDDLQEYRKEAELTGKDKLKTLLENQSDSWKDLYLSEYGDDYSNVVNDFWDMYAGMPYGFAKSSISRQDRWKMSRGAREMISPRDPVEDEDDIVDVDAEGFPITQP
jgi:hypothetical protein